MPEAMVKAAVPEDIFRDSLMARVQESATLLQAALESQLDRWVNWPTLRHHTAPSLLLPVAYGGGYHYAVSHCSVPHCEVSTVALSCIALHCASLSLTALPSHTAW